MKIYCRSELWVIGQKARQGPTCSAGARGLATEPLPRWAPPRDGPFDVFRMRRVRLAKQIDISVCRRPPFGALASPPPGPEFPQAGDSRPSARGSPLRAPCSRVPTDAPGLSLGRPSGLGPGSDFATGFNRPPKAAGPWGRAPQGRPPRQREGREALLQGRARAPPRSARRPGRSRSSRRGREGAKLRPNGGGPAGSGARPDRLIRLARRSAHGARPPRRSPDLPGTWEGPDPLGSGALPGRVAGRSSSPMSGTPCPPATWRRSTFGDAGLNCRVRNGIG